MKVGITGFARSGKTTLFNALTGAHAAVGAYGSRDANVAVIKVPDERVDRLTEIYQPRKVTYAEIEFVDVAPAEAGGEQQALDETSLHLLKNTEALVHVVRAFENPSVIHPLGGVGPVRDVDALEEELKLADLIIIERRIERLEKENKRDREYEVVCRCRDHIEAGKPLRTLELTEQEEKTIQGFTFLSQKPLMLVANYGENRIGEEDPAGLAAYAAEHALTLIHLCGAMEMEIAELEESERAEFRQDLGLGEESKTAFIRAAYHMLGLISFLTVGEPEVHAWTITRGTRAVDAAGVIHSDIKRGFIRAETIAYDEFMRAGSMPKAKELGLVRLEGKDYVVQDGDIILFRFNV